MTIETFMKKILKEVVDKLFDLDKLRFGKIVLTKDTAESITLLARENHPKEFLAFLDGRIKDKKLIIDGLLYQEYYSTTHSAAPIFHFPDKTFYGSVHSHPGPSNKPSSADRQFFGKIGIINIIIKYPYHLEDMRFYNHNAEEINVEIGT